MPDPRNLLGRMDARLREQGMVPVGAVELEFFLMDRDAALSGNPQAPKGADRARAAAALPGLQSPGSRRFAPFFTDLYAFAEIQGLPARTLISEYAPGQMEVVLQHRGDVLKAGDEAIMLKRLIKAGPRGMA